MLKRKTARLAGSGCLEHGGHSHLYGSSQLLQVLAHLQAAHQAQHAVIYDHVVISCLALPTSALSPMLGLARKGEMGARKNTVAWSAFPAHYL